MGALYYGYTNVFKKNVEITCLIDNRRSDVIAKNDWVGRYGYSNYDLPDPYQGHIGMDIRASIGTPVYALGNGTVREVDNSDNDANGLHVGYDFDGYRVTYRHLNYIKVSNGQKVNKDTLIGYTGETGAEGQPHLHIDIKGLSSGKWYDPYDLIRAEEDIMNTLYFSRVIEDFSETCHYYNDKYKMGFNRDTGKYKDKNLQEKWDSPDFTEKSKPVISNYSHIYESSNYKYWVHVANNQYGNKVYFVYKREDK